MPPVRVSLRPAADSDLEFLHRVYASTRTEELAPVPWTPEQKAAFLRSQSEMQHRHYRATRPDASYEIILCDGHPAGRLYVARTKSEIRIMDIALLPEFRGRGIGTQLLKKLCDEGDAAGLLITIHVEQNNPALRLYERLGFRRVEENGPYFMLARQPIYQKGQGSVPKISTHKCA